MAIVNIEWSTGTGITLSKNNKTVTVASHLYTAKANAGRSSGKYYYEISYDANSTANAIAIGIVNSSASLVTYDITSNYQRAYYAVSGNKIPENTSYGSAYNTSDVVGVLLDLDNGVLKFYKNGISQGVSHTNLKSMGAVYPSIKSAGTNVSVTATANFGDTGFKYLPSDLPKDTLSYNGSNPFPLPLNKILFQSNNKTYSLDSIDTWYETKMTSDTTPAPLVASASSVFGTGYEAYKAFDGNIYSSWNTKVGDSSNQWLQLYTGKRRMITGYRMTPVSTSQVNLNQMPNTWELQGSNDGINWETLDKRESQKWESFEYKEYGLKVYEYYLYHRLYIYSNNGHTNIVIGEISFKTSKITQLPKSSKENFIKFGQSSLVGIGSILTGKNYILQLPEGNNGGIFEQIISRKPLAISSTNKLAILHYGIYYSSSDGAGATLTPLNNSSEVETLGFNSLTLSQDIYNLVGETFKVVAFSNNEDDITIETTTKPFTVYDEFGDSVEVLCYTDDETVTEAGLVLEAKWAPFHELEGDFEVVNWTDRPVEEIENISTQLVITAAPHPQLILPTKDINISSIERFEKIKLNSVVSGRGILKVIFSFDSGNSWVTWDGTQFTQIHPLLADVLTNGISPTALEAMNMDAFNDLRSYYDTFRMAYAMKIQDTADQSATDELSFQIEMKGTWKAAVHGRDYDYEYPDNSSVTITLYQSGDFKMNV